MNPTDLPFEYAEWFRIVRRKYLIGILRRAGGNQCQAALLAGVHRNTVKRMMLEDGITAEDIYKIKVSPIQP